MKWIATLGPIGYLPASGTWASLVTLLVIYGLHALQVSWLLYSAITLAIGLLSIYAIKVCQPYFKHHDPGEIVIDEVLGCFITFLFVPFDTFGIYTPLIGFTLFRFFDITKIFGIRLLERQGGVAGVMLDDIAAGVVSNLIMHGFFWLLIGV